METTCENDANNVSGLKSEHFLAVENNFLASKDPVPQTQEVHVNKRDDTPETGQNEEDGEQLEIPDELKSPKDIANGETKLFKRCVSFPDDSDIVTGFLDPPDPWKNDPGWKTEDLVQAYKRGCENHNTKPSNKLLQQLQCIDNVSERYEILSLKGEKLDIRQCESLEEIFRLVRFRCLDLEATNLDDETSVALCDMVEYYGTACKLNISFNKNIGPRGWQGISKLIRKTPCLTVIDARNCDVNERVVPLLGRSLRMGCYLTRLQLQNTNLSGRALLILVAALKLNETLEELFIGDNKFMPTDGVQLGNLLKYNHTLQLLDLRNNHLQDDGVSHVCDGLAEQTMGSGLLTLVLWNNQLTFHAMVAINKALAASESLDTINLGHNPITNEGIHVLKDGLLKTRSLLKLGMSGTKITCEGAIALAEVIADSPRLIRLDLQENDIKTAGLMALSLALKVNDSLTRLDIDRETKKEPGMKDYAEQQRRLQRDITTFLERNRDLAYNLNKENKQLEIEKAETPNEQLEIIEILENSEPAPTEISYIPSDDKIQRPKLLFVTSNEGGILSRSIDGELRTFSSPFAASCLSPTQSVATSIPGADILSPQYCHDPKLTAKQLFSVNKWSSPTVTSPVAADTTYPIIITDLPTMENPIQLCQPLESVLPTQKVDIFTPVETQDGAGHSNVSESLIDSVPHDHCNTLEAEQQDDKHDKTIRHLTEGSQDILNPNDSSSTDSNSAGTLDELVNEMGEVSVIENTETVEVSVIEHTETVVTDTGCGEGCMEVKRPAEVYADVEDDRETSLGDYNHCQSDADTNTNASISCDSEHVDNGCEGIDMSDTGQGLNEDGFEAIERCNTVLVQSTDIGDCDSVDTTTVLVQSTDIGDCESVDTAVVTSHSNIPGGVYDGVYDGAITSDTDSSELILDTEIEGEFSDCATTGTLIDHNYVAVKTPHTADVEFTPHSNSQKSDENEISICSIKEVIDNAGRNDQRADAEQLNLHKEIECDSLDIEKWNTVERSEIVQSASDTVTRPNVNVTKPDFFTSMTLNGLKQELASLIDDEGNQMGSVSQ